MPYPNSDSFRFPILLGVILTTWLMTPATWAQGSEEPILPEIPDLPELPPLPEEAPEEDPPSSPEPSLSPSQTPPPSQPSQPSQPFPSQTEIKRDGLHSKAKSQKGGSSFLPAKLPNILPKAPVHRRAYEQPAHPAGLRQIVMRVQRGKEITLPDKASFLNLPGFAKKLAQYSDKPITTELLGDLRREVLLLYLLSRLPIAEVYFPDYRNLKKGEKVWEKKLKMVIVETLPPSRSRKNIASQGLQRIRFRIRQGTHEVEASRDHPLLCSPELSQQLAEYWGKPMTKDRLDLIRKTLLRFYLEQKRPVIGILFPNLDFDDSPTGITWTDEITAIIVETLQTPKGPPPPPGLKRIAYRYVRNDKIQPPGQDDPLKKGGFLESLQWFQDQPVTEDLLKRVRSEVVVHYVRQNRPVPVVVFPEFDSSTMVDKVYQKELQMLVVEPSFSTHFGIREVNTQDILPPELPQEIKPE